MKNRDLILKQAQEEVLVLKKENIKLRQENLEMQKTIYSQYDSITELTAKLCEHEAEN